MTSIKELFEESVRYDEKLLAHYLMCLLQEGKISLDDDESALCDVVPNRDKLEAMVTGNELGINQIKIYSLKCDANKFAFIYAESEQQAVQHFLALHNMQPLNCIEHSLDYPIMIGDRFISFRDYRNELNVFPCHVGFYKRW